MIEVYLLSFVAGILTVLAPCTLPLLPVVIGGGSLHGNNRGPITLRQPLTIITSLVLSIFVFTLLLKSTTALLGVPASVWAVVSGGIILLFGIHMLLPVFWETTMDKTRLGLLATRLMGSSQQEKGIKKDILLGAALGPVFNSCSPTYALIVAVILPSSFLTGIGYLVAYVIGLGLVLLLISIFGRIIVNKLRWASNPTGVFHKVIGCIFIIVGIFIMFGIDKQIQTYIIDNGYYDPIMHIERSLQ